MGNRETNLTYSLAKIFAVILGSTPRPTGLEMPGFVKAGVGVWRSTEDVPAEVMSTKVDIPGSDVAASCEVSFCLELRMHCRTVSWTMGIAAAMQVSTSWLKSSV